MLPLLLPALLGGAPAWCSCQWLGHELLGGLGTFANDSRASPYNRLPAEARGRVSAGPWSMSRAPAGAFLQWTTDTTLMYLNATVDSYLGQVTNLDTSLLGWAGFDLYARAEGAACNVTTPGGGCWRWVSSASSWSFRNSLATMEMQPLAIPCASNCTSGGAPQLNAGGGYRGATHTFRLHLPTHAELLSVSIGVPDGATITADRSWQQPGPIVWYGTSILQCTAVARPGHCVTNQVSRLLEREVLNFGFNGVGTMELSIAEYLVQITNAALFIIDCSAHLPPAAARSCRSPHPPIPTPIPLTVDCAHPLTTVRPGQTGTWTRR